VHAVQARPDLLVGLGVLKLQCLLLIGRDHRDAGMDVAEHLGPSGVIEAVR